ncbi:Tetratricopeptide repeat like superfamily protein [Actinidia chinensis var. chinensis]|uniref:Tetratricopeptide repeat like superfamily protein n=1 Tax=Actinidia chinensis var. chinensis TaxID=1590841 RepID=A0A2R6QY74_ACTCC|nr:Tetratricopeptide repeat like superfamily protein [Actinidia chinensis var. chinensis]
MVTDILMQMGLILVSVFMFLLMYNVPQKAFAKLRSYRNKTATQSKRHFVLGAQLLSRAQSEAAQSESRSALAQSAAEEADKSIALDPHDAAAHILKALALDLQGFRTSALDSLDVALSPIAKKSLSSEEKGDALFKRAELKMGLSEQIDSAIADLVESVKLRSDSARVYSVLGECYEKKGLVEEAKKAYEEAVRVEPKWKVAREALERLGSVAN